MTDTTELQDSITDYWNHRGTAYDAQPGHGIQHDAERDAWHDELRALLPATPSDVLDVGTGTGFLALAIAELGHRTTGVDLSDGMLAQARLKSEALPADRRPALLTGDAHEPPVPPASQDVVISRHVLWTLRDPAFALANWHALLRPGGRLIVVDGLWWQGRDPSEGGPTEPEARARWEAAYGAAARAQLPTMLAQNMAPIVGAVEAAGFADVRLGRLDAVERVERATEPGRDRGNERYVLSARRPARSLS